MNSSLQFSRHDVADPISVLSLADSPLEPLAPGFVRIEVKARAVNPADILFIQGIYGNMVGDQIKDGKAQTGGCELSGVIVEVGAGVANFKVGQRVYANTLYPRSRGWARFVDAPAQGVLVPLPDQVSFSDAAQLLVNPMTALGFLETMVNDGLKDNDIYVLTGGNSALCKMVLQLARLRKLTFRAVCVVRSASVRAELHALGAFAVIAQDETPNVKTAVEALAPEGVKATFDSYGGGPVPVSLLRTLAEGATQYVYGLLVPETLALDVAAIGDMLFRGTRLSGWYLGFFLEKNYARLPQLFAEVLGYLAKRELVFKSKEFDFVTQWREALQYTRDGAKEGKAILVSK